MQTTQLTTASVSTANIPASARGIASSTSAPVPVSGSRRATCLDNTTPPGKVTFTATKSADVSGISSSTSTRITVSRAYCESP
jgi:hypothetical protein